MSKSELIAMYKNLAETHGANAAAAAAHPERFAEYPGYYQRNVEMEAICRCFVHQLENMTE